MVSEVYKENEYFEIRLETDNLKIWKGRQN